MAYPTWRGDAPTRDITIYKGEDIKISGKLSRVVRDANGAIVRDASGRPQRESWVPPDGTQMYFVVYHKDASPDTTIPVTLDDHKFSTHIEATTAATIGDGDEFWLYIKTPDTPNGNPTVISTGTASRRDPHGVQL